MTGADWSDQRALAIALYLDGSDDPDRADDGSLMVDDDFLVLVNAWWEQLLFTIPTTRPAITWQLEIDSYAPTHSGVVAVGDQLAVGPRSVVVLRGLSS